MCAGSRIYNAEHIPTTPGDNSHYVEGVSRYVWMPDGDGVSHLVDLHDPVQAQPRNGANNRYWLYTRFVNFKIYNHKGKSKRDEK